MRHDSIRDLLRQEIDNAGLTTEIERNAGSSDKSRPGDIKVLNWEDGKYLYIDVAIVNPMSKMRRNCLIKEGVGRLNEIRRVPKERHPKGQSTIKQAYFNPSSWRLKRVLGRLRKTSLLK